MEVEQSSVSEERAAMSLWGGGTALRQGWALPSSFHRGGGLWSSLGFHVLLDTCDKVQ